MSADYHTNTENTNTENIDIGSIIELDGNKYQIIGTDLTSGKHPAGIYPKWDYLLQRTDNRGIRRITREDLAKAAILEV